MHEAPIEIFYFNRLVRYCGRYYRVDWCNGEYVSINARQGIYGGMYQCYPGGGFDFNEWVVPVNHVFLQAM